MLRMVLWAFAALLLGATVLPGAAQSVSGDDDPSHALATADSLYDLAFAAHEDGAYADAERQATEGLLALLPYAEPTTDAILPIDYGDERAASGVLLLHLNTQRVNLRVDPDALAAARQYDREADRLFSARTGVVGGSNANLQTATETAKKAEAAYEDLYGQRHLGYLHVLERHTTRYRVRQLPGDARETLDKLHSVLEPLVGPQRRATFLSMYMEAYGDSDKGYEDVQNDLSDLADYANENDLVIHHIFALRVQEMTAFTEAAMADDPTDADPLYEEAAAYRQEADAIMAEAGLSDEQFRYSLPPGLRMVLSQGTFDTLFTLLERHHTWGIMTAEEQPLESARRFQLAADNVLPIRDMFQDVMLASMPLIHGMKLIALQGVQGAAMSGLLTLATTPNANPRTVVTAYNVVIQHKARDFDRETRQKRAFLADERPFVSQTYQGVRRYAQDVAGLTYAAPDLPASEEPEVEPEPEPKKRSRLGRFARRVGDTARGSVEAAKGGIGAAKDAKSGELLVGDSLVAVYMSDLQMLKNSQVALEHQLQSYGSVPPPADEPVSRDIAERLPLGAHLVDIVKYFPYDFPSLNELIQGDTTRAVLFDEEAFSQPERYVAFVMDDSKTVRVVDLGEAARIDTLVSEYRSKLETFDPRRSGRRPQERAAQELGQITSQIHAAVVQPLGLPNEGSVFLSPDGLLRILPFETLQDDTGAYLIDRYEFTYLASARSLLDAKVDAGAYASTQHGAHTFMPRPMLASLDAPELSTPAVRDEADTEAADVLVFGGVDYGVAAGTSAENNSNEWLTRSVENTPWLPLAATQEEVDFIQTSLDVSDEHVFRAEKARETTLLQSRSPRRMHIATHGFFFESQFSWLLDPKQKAVLSNAFLDRLFPNTRAHEDLEEDDPSMMERGLSRFGAGRTVLDVRDKALTYENRVQQANAFLDDLENLPKRKDEIEMDLVRWTDPLVRSGLVLAERNTIARERASFDGDRLRAFSGTDDGLATAYEISWMDLRNTDLIVLSACETGLGDIVTGEGVYGLGRSFQTAGAKTVVMSLWQVDDKATQDLMTAFYDGIDDGTAHTSALRKAALTVRESQPHPYFWGAFVAMGRSE